MSNVRNRGYNTFDGQAARDRGSAGSRAGSSSGYRTTPEEIEDMPPGVPYIVANECAERFSFYGMKTILVVFMQKYMMDAAGKPDHLDDEEARSWYHTFSMVTYATPLLGAFVSDVVLGKYRTILYFSIVYCGGHLALALNETRVGVAIGLSLIAFGAGGIKPCVSANVGDQFGAANQHLLTKVFGYFYFSINLGAFTSSLITPVLLAEVRPGRRLPPQRQLGAARNRTVSPPLPLTRVRAVGTVRPARRLRAAGRADGHRNGRLLDGTLEVCARAAFGAHARGEHPEGRGLCRARAPAAHLPLRGGLLESVRPGRLGVGAAGGRPRPLARSNHSPPPSIPPTTRHTRWAGRCMAGGHTATRV